MAQKMRFDVEGLTKLEKALEEAKKLRARVGILGSKTERGGPETNAEIGAKHEFGFTISEGAFQGSRVPARSFLRMPFMTHISDVMKMVKPKVTSMFAAGRLGAFFAELGVAGEWLVDKAFQTGGWGAWTPNAPTTVMLKGSDKPLIDKGALRRSISSIVTRVK